MKESEHKTNGADKPLSPPIVEMVKGVNDALGYKRDLHKNVTGKRLTDDEAAEKIGIDRVSLINYKKGKTVPEPVAARAFADYCYGNNEARIIALLQLFDNARLSRHRTKITDDPLDRLAAGQGLRVSKNLFGYFSTFLDKTFTRLFDLGSLVQTGPSVSQTLNIHDSLWRGYIDLGIGYFATVDRLVLAHAWSTPIRIGIGAVVPDKYKDLIQTKVHPILTGHTHNQPQALDSRYKLIVARNDIGAIHCLSTLKIAEGAGTFVVEVGDQAWADEIRTKKPTVARLLADAVADSLEREPGIVPIVVVNEYTSFEVIERLRLLKIPAVPALPLFSRENARQFPRRDLPAYFMGISCSRKHPQLREMIQQLLLSTLATEIESIAHDFLDLYEKLMDRVQGVSIHYGLNDETERFKAAYNWCLYVLGLDRYSIAHFPNGGLPWKAILERTREQALANIGENELRVRQLTNIGKSQILKQDFAKICQSLDLALKLKDVEWEYVLEDQDILMRTIRNDLRGMPPALPIEYYTLEEKKEQLKPGGQITLHCLSDKNTGDERRVLEGFVVDLENFYSNHLRSSAKRFDDSESQILIQNIQNLLEQTDIDPAQIRQVIAEHFKKCSTPDLARMNPVERIRHFRQWELPTFGKKEHERVIFASFGKTAPRYVGCACLRPYAFEKIRANALEIFYLSVPPRYQQLAIGAQIIRAAKAFAREHGYHSLVIEVLRTLNDAVTYFRHRGFEPLSTRDVNRFVMTLDPNKPDELLTTKWIGTGDRR